MLDFGIGSKTVHGWDYFAEKKTGITADFFFFWEAPLSKPTNPTTLRLPVALHLLVARPVLQKIPDPDCFDLVCSPCLGGF